MESEKLSSITVASNDINYSSEDGMLLNKDKTVLIRCPQGKSGGCKVPDL